MRRFGKVTDSYRRELHEIFVKDKEWERKVTAKVETFVIFFLDSFPLVIIICIPDE